VIGILRPSNLEAVMSHSVGLPPQLFERWVDAPPPDFQRMVAPLLSARDGDLVSDTQAIQGRFREELELLHRLQSEGFGEAAGYRAATRRTPDGKEEFRFVTLALQAGASFTEEHRRELAVLQPVIRGALDRMSVPLVASQSILAQVLEDGETGFMCLTKAGALVEANRRMHLIVARYAATARIPAGRGALGEFGLQAAASAHASWIMAHEDGQSVIEVSVHRLAKEAHAIPTDLLLVMAKERQVDRRPKAEYPGLTERQAAIAEQMIVTGLSYKQLADRLKISPGTMRKHAENIFRALGVQSRAELCARYR
jgi:DNA-binding CsgD family transcriptional regulator